MTGENIGEEFRLKEIDRRRYYFLNEKIKQNEFFWIFL